MIKGFRVGYYYRWVGKKEDWPLQEKYYKNHIMKNILDGIPRKCLATDGDDGAILEGITTPHFNATNATSTSNTFWYWNPRNMDCYNCLKFLEELDPLAALLWKRREVGK